jgi:hypothetical protein
MAERVSWAVDLTTVYASLLLMVLADAGKSVRYLAGRAVWQASGTYRGGEGFRGGCTAAPRSSSPSALRARSTLTGP